MDKPKPPTLDLKHQQWLGKISAYPFASVHHISTNEIFTSDGLSRGAIWQELAAAEDDFGVWDLAAPAVAECRPSPTDISRHAVRHLRHETCDAQERGIHSWADLQTAVRAATGHAVTVSRIQEALPNNERVPVFPQSAAAVCGHTRGAPLPTLFTKGEGCSTT